jgi:hypothetical protein
MKYLIFFLITALVAFVISAFSIYSTVAKDSQDLVVFLITVAIVEILFLIVQLFKPQKR